MATRKIEHVCTPQPPRDRADFFWHHAFDDLACAIAFELGADVTASAALPNTLVLGPHLCSAWEQEVAEDAILFDLEQQLSCYMDQLTIDLYRKHTVWSYTQKNADSISDSCGGQHVRVVPIGPTTHWDNRISRGPEYEIDVLSYGVLTDRRAQVLFDIGQAQPGLRVRHVQNCWGEQRDEMISRSRLVLNVHAYDEQVFEIVRCAYLLQNAVSLVSETGKDPFEEQYKDSGIIWSNYDNLVETVLCSLAQPQATLQAGADHAHDHHMCNWSLKDNLLTALSS